MSETLLTPAARAKAERAIENMHLAYYVKGGIRELAEQLEEQVENTSQHIYGLARYAYQRAEGDFDQALELFRALCSHAEETYKATHDVPNVYESLPVWRVFKANIARGLRNEVSPLEYRTESAYRKAVSDLVLPAGGSASPAELTQIQEWLDTISVPRNLRRPLSRMVLIAEFLQRKRVHEAERILKDAESQLAQLADKRKPVLRRALTSR